MPLLFLARSGIVDCAFVFFLSFFPYFSCSSTSRTVRLLCLGFLFTCSTPFLNLLSRLAVDSSTLLSCEPPILFRAFPDLSPLPRRKPTSQPKLLLLLTFACIPLIPATFFLFPNCRFDKKFHFRWTKWEPSRHVGFPVVVFFSPLAPPLFAKDHSSTARRGLASSAHVHSFVSLSRRVCQAELLIPNAKTRHPTETVLLGTVGTLPLPSSADVMFVFLAYRLSNLGRIRMLLPWVTLTCTGCGDPVAS